MAKSRFSRGDLLALVAVLAIFGIVVSAYLAWQWYDAASSTWCDLGDYFSCTKVRESPFSAVAGIPVAMAGVAGFGILFSLAVVALRGFDRVGPSSTVTWLFGFALLGGVIGLGLTLVEIFVIEAICILCTVGFALDLAILAVAFALRRPDLNM